MHLPQAAKRLLGNTRPLNVIAQLIRPLLVALGFEGWLGSDDWLSSEHAPRLSGDATRTRDPAPPEALEDAC